MVKVGPFDREEDGLDKDSFFGGEEGLKKGGGGAL